MSDDAPLPVTVAVTGTPVPESFSIPQVVALARDLAMELYEEPILLKKHGVTPAQYVTLKGLPYFQKVVTQLTEEWNSPKTAQARLAIQAAVGLEEVLPDVIARAKIKNEPLQGIATLVKVLADISGAIGPKNQQAPSTEKFKITINLGADTEVYNKSKPTVILESTEAPDGPEVRPLAQGFGALLTLSPEPEKA